MSLKMVRYCIHHMFFFYFRCWKNHGFSPLGRSTSPRPTAGGSMHVPQVPLYPSVVTSASADVESYFGLVSMTSWCREDSWRFWTETLRPVLSPGRWDLQQDAQMKSGVTMGASIIARSSVLLGRRECNPLIRKQLFLIFVFSWDREEGTCRAACDRSQVIRSNSNPTVARVTWPTRLC